jgi:hypothetical protein
MTRTKKAADTINDSQAPDVFDEQIAANNAAAAIAEDVAEATRMPEENGHANGEKKVYPKARSWKLDNAAGVELMSYTDKDHGAYEMWIRFREGKPSDEVRQAMKEQGFKWHPDAPKGGGHFDVEGAWVHKTGYSTGNADRYTAEKTYQTVVDLVRKEKGIEPEVAM